MPSSLDLNLDDSRPFVVDGDGCDLQDPNLYATAPVPHQVREQPVLPLGSKSMVSKNNSGLIHMRNTNIRTWGCAKGASSISSTPNAPSLKLASPTARDRRTASKPRGDDYAATPPPTAAAAAFELPLPERREHRGR